MPTYEYECSMCERSFEETVPIDRRDRVMLCICGHVATRVFSGPIAVHFKGPGFYVNDYPKEAG